MSRMKNENVIKLTLKHISEYCIDVTLWMQFGKTNFISKMYVSKINRNICILGLLLSNVQAIYKTYSYKKTPCILFVNEPGIFVFLENFFIFL